MPHSKLDAIDRKILAELQADGRMTNVELAKRVGISAPPCLRRVRTLEERASSAATTPMWMPAMLGFEVQVFAMVGLHQPGRGRSVRLRGALPPGRSCASATC
jgi:DNA-binding Lrp family transcriptional regulator